MFSITTGCPIITKINIAKQYNGKIRSDRLAKKLIYVVLKDPFVFNNIEVIKKPLITKETARSGRSIKTYSNNKVSEALNFSFISIEKTIAEEDSLQKYLIWQIQLLNISEQDKKIAETIIDYINNGSSFDSVKLEEDFKINVEDTNRCPFYSGLIIKNIKVGPSSKELQNKLKSIGLKPINNIVDITNFVMHEIGQPLHAFDLDKLENINVKSLKSGTKFKTLDENIIELDKEDLMICSNNIFLRNLC